MRAQSHEAGRPSGCWWKAAEMLLSWDIGQPSSRIQGGIESVQQRSILRQTSRPATPPQWAGVSHILCLSPGRVARCLPHPLRATGFHEERLLPSRMFVGCRSSDICGCRSQVSRENSTSQDLENSNEQSSNFSLLPK